TITVKRVAGGPVSNHLHDAVAVGDRLHADGPYGLFSTSFHPAEKHLFLSAGSGITPIMSMVRTLRARPSGEATEIVFVYSASSPADIIFRPELEQLAQVPGVRVEILCSRDSPIETWPGRRGRITAETLAEVAPDLRDRETFVCGPGGYMDAVRPLLFELGSAGAHEESFVFATAPSARLARASTQQAGTAHAIDFSASGRTVVCEPGTTVLDAAHQAGLPVPSSCSEGMCGTCKSGLVSGEVEMNHAGGIRPTEIAAGKFLPCCSTPLTDLVVDRRAHRECTASPHGHAQGRRGYGRDMPKLSIAIAATEQIEAKRVQSVNQGGARVVTVGGEATDETRRGGYTPVGRPIFVGLTNGEPISYRFD